MKKKTGFAVAVLLFGCFAACNAPVERIAETSAAVVVSTSYPAGCSSCADVASAVATRDEACSSDDGFVVGGVAARDIWDGVSACACTLGSPCVSACAGTGKVFRPGTPLAGQQFCDPQSDVFAMPQYQAQLMSAAERGCFACVNHERQCGILMQLCGASNVGAP